jgi:hypothetical protein
MFYDDIVSLATVTPFLKYVENKFGHGESQQVNAWFYTMKVQRDPKYHFPPNEGYGINSTKVVALDSEHSKMEVMVGYADVPGLLLLGAKEQLDDLKANVKGRDYKHWDELVNIAAQKRYNIGKLWVTWHHAVAKVEDRIEHYYKTYGRDMAEMLEFGTTGDKVRTLEKIRAHQKIKAEGKTVLMFKKGGHTKGQFILYSASGDGKPLLLLSSKEDKAVKEKWIRDSLGVKLSNCKTFEGKYHNDRGVWKFVVTGGDVSGWAQIGYQAATKGGKGKDPWVAMFGEALRAMGIAAEPKVDAIQRRNSMGLSGSGSETVPGWE